MHTWNYIFILVHDTCFTPLQFVGLVMEESSFQVEMSANVYVALAYNGNHLTLTAISVLMFATVGLFLVLYMHHSWGAVGTVLAQSQVARHTMRSTMLISWVLLPWAVVHFYMVTKEMAEAVHEKRPLTLFPDLYSPQVTAGYGQLGSFLAILLLEAPCLGVFFLRKATDLHIRRQKLSKTDCRLCYWFTVLCDTLGDIGVVAASQIGSVYLFYCALYLIVSPTLIVAWMSHFAAIIASSLVCITILLHTLDFSCKTCSFGKITKGLAFLLLGLLSIAINSYLFQQVRRDKQASHDVIHNLLRSVVSSIIIGINGYAVKRLLFPKKGVEETERGNQELKPLIKGDGNFP